MIYKPFSVVAVPFPFTDMDAHKKRPAIVISSELFQKHNKHVSLIMVTTAKNSEWYGDHEIQDLKATGLSVNSIVRQKIFTIDSRLVLKQIGKLSAKDVKAVQKAFHQAIKITD
ncbi:MAG: type II toxin-antitoxin system PemK/MazF family toxin [Gammaproteobacteria bacterium]|nr:type II toxin-antitoxin system PemK/MazF family toxin [Gammaproteobacteria bacterium]